MNRIEHISKKIPIEWFINPGTKEKISPNKINDWINKHTALQKEKSSSSIKYEYYNFSPSKIEEEKDEINILDTWMCLQSNGMVSYNEDPEHNLAVGDRIDSRIFADFCNFEGKVLDIGVGPQQYPSHMEYWNKKEDTNEVFFVGIDPLIGTFPKKFAYVKGFSEYLPFIDGLFDQVLFVTSLDHLFNPYKAFQEAKRVLKDDGEIIIWNTEKDPKTPKPVTTNMWYERLQVPEGAEDRFHLKKYSEKDMQKMFKDNGLDNFDKLEVNKSEYKREVFYKCKLITK